MEREEDRLRPVGQSPTLAEYMDSSYKRQLHLSGERDTTITKELGYVRYWRTQLGHLRLNKIRTHHLKEVLTNLAEEDYSPRSVNLYLIAVRGILTSALHDGHIKPPLPFEGLAWQRVDTKKRQLYAPAEIGHLLRGPSRTCSQRAEREGEPRRVSLEVMIRCTCDRASVSQCSEPP